MEQRSALWNPHVALGLRAAGVNANEILCVGTTSTSGLEPCHCTRVVSPSDTDVANRLLAEMASHMPDQIDHDALLRLAEACLCPTNPNPHRGSQEAAVIYRWTEMLSAEACVLRAPVVPVSPKSRGEKKTSNPRIATDLTIHIEPLEPVIRFPTPTPMSPADFNNLGRKSRTVKTITIPHRDGPIDTTAVITRTHQSETELPPTPPDSATLASHSYPVNNVANHNASELHRLPTSIPSPASCEASTSTKHLNASAPCPLQPLHLASPKFQGRLYPDSPRQQHNGEVAMAQLLAESLAHMRQLLKEMGALRNEVGECREEVQRLRGELAAVEGLSGGHKEN
ncbi:hypothetical protein B0T14DRAFT_508751 [Immersiella caudata]|uniref:Uncharacterized protein n=1 Tax=Immersiella caudata TaxID=314043 RepID=A0AA39X248_9PEZI|nr:hypothetical protein B0T14DRAFT_508751 [Immersiella caudata]